MEIVVVFQFVLRKMCILFNLRAMKSIGFIHVPMILWSVEKTFSVFFILLKLTKTNIVFSIHLSSFTRNSSKQRGSSTIFRISVIWEHFFLKCIMQLHIFIHVSWFSVLQKKLLSYFILPNRLTFMRIAHEFVLSAN